MNNKEKHEFYKENLKDIYKRTAEEVVQELPKTIFKVYHLGNFVKDVEEDSDSLNSFYS